MIDLYMVVGSGEFAQAKVYHFKTEEEKEAFLFGAAEVVGWMDYEYVGDSLTMKEWERINAIIQ